MCFVTRVRDSERRKREGPRRLSHQEREVVAKETGTRLAVEEVIGSEIVNGKVEDVVRWGYHYAELQHPIEVYHPENSPYGRKIFAAPTLAQIDGDEPIEEPPVLVAV